MYCLDAATGKLRWEFWTDGWAAKTPAVADGRVYSIIDKKGYCLSAAAGKKIWETEFISIYGVNERHKKVQTSCQKQE